MAEGACATPYRPQTADDRHGYRHVLIQPDVYFVEFTGNVYTVQETATRYWQRRSQDVCAENGRISTELIPDPLSVPAPRMPMAPRAGFVFLSGEPLGATGDAHSRSGFIQCLAADSQDPDRDDMTRARRWMRP
jgi:hypothetical protein